MKPTPTWVYIVGILCLSLIFSDNKGCALTGIGGIPAPYKAPLPSAIVLYDDSPTSKEDLQKNHPDQWNAIISNAPGSPKDYVNNTLKGDYVTMGISDPSPQADLGWVVDAYKIWTDDGKKANWIVGASPNGKGFHQALPDKGAEIDTLLHTLAP